MINSGFHEKNNPELNSEITNNQETGKKLCPILLINTPKYEIKALVHVLHYGVFQTLPTPSFIFFLK